MDIAILGITHCHVFYLKTLRFGDKTMKISKIVSYTRYYGQLHVLKQNLAFHSHKF
jgi:hypothetical protein